MNYIASMSQRLEKRVEELEKKVAVLSARVLDLRPRQKDWRRTAGSTTDDEWRAAAYEQFLRDDPPEDAVYDSMR
jgi:predicted  nucleic acid-binding Zn-ribbon protein